MICRASGLHEREMMNYESTPIKTKDVTTQVLSDTTQHNTT